MYLPCFAYLVDLFCLDGFDFRILLTRTTREEWLGARNSRITLVFPMLFKDGAQNHRQNR